MAVRRRSTKKARRASKRVTRRRVVRKARKAKKAKRVPMIGTKRQVWNGSRTKTVGGLHKKDLMLSKAGKIVSKRQAKRGLTMMKKNGLGKWIAAVQKVRKEMGLKGFVAIKKGTPYYAAVKKAYEA